MKTNEYAEIENILKTKTVFTKNELLDTILKIGPNKRPDFSRYYFFELKKKGLIYKLNKDLYSTTTKKFDFIYRPTDLENELSEIINDKFCETSICIWNTTFLTEFLHLIPLVSYTFIEVEPHLMEYIYFFLKKDYNGILLNPTLRELHLYSYGENRIIIKKLPQRSPVIKEPDMVLMPESEELIKGYKAAVKPTIEKILVDAFLEYEIFPIFYEIENIFKAALKVYCVNFNRLFAYAKYRNCENIIGDFIKQEINYDINNGCFK